MEDVCDFRVVRSVSDFDTLRGHCVVVIIIWTVLPTMYTSDEVLIERFTIETKACYGYTQYKYRDVVHLQLLCTLQLYNKNILLLFIIRIGSG